MITTHMVGGGQFGGRVRTVWYSQRQPSSTKSILVYTQMKCQHQLETL